MPENLPRPDMPLQFETAEYTTLQPRGTACSLCKAPIAQIYYTANKSIVCEPCQVQVKAMLNGGSKFARAFAAAALGVLAGLAGATLWYMVRNLTQSEFGIVAIAVGLMVGVAVRKGCKGRGGWFYQTLAITLTYFAVSAQYMPDLVEGVMQRAREHHAASANNPPPGNARDKIAAKNEPAEKPEPVDADAPETGTVKMILASALFLIFAFLISLTLPVVVGMHSPISLLILGIALYEAWKINKGSSIRIAGPFQLAPASASGAPGL